MNFEKKARLRKPVKQQKEEDTLKSFDALFDFRGMVFNGFKS